MYEIPLQIQSAIRKYQPVTVDGLTLYPIQVKNRNAFFTASPAISFMQQTLPVSLMRVPLLSAYWQMEMQDAVSGEEGMGLFYRALLFLALAFRLGEGQSDIERVRKFEIIVDPDKPEQLKALRFMVNGMEQTEITPAQFQRLRPVLAAQNGIHMETEDANPELVEAERDSAESNSVKLDADPDAQISFVAALSHTEECEIEEWPILKLKRRENTYTHLIHYFLCGVAEAEGRSWKCGNPYPHPYYERTKTISGGLRDIKDVLSGEAQKAIDNPGEKVSQ